LTRAVTTLTVVHAEPLPTALTNVEAGSGQAERRVS